MYKVIETPCEIEKAAKKDEEKEYASVEKDLGK